MFTETVLLKDAQKIPVRNDVLWVEPQIAQKHNESVEMFLASIH